MKIRHKKLIASGIALSLAGVLGAGALLQTSVSVQASYAMMPGIEQIVKDTSEEKPFKILEIVDNTNEAEIGYYVSGQEPYVKLYKYTYTYKDKTTNEEKTKTIQFSSLKEGLEKLPTETLRKEFATNIKTATGGTLSDTDTGIKNIQSSSYQAGSTDAEENYPLSYSKYQEKYFLSDSDDTEKWQKINFQKIDGNGNIRTDTVEIKGNYRENTAGTGDYTKQEQQYYPIRQDDNDDKAKPEKYRENIQNFYYADNNTADAPYFLEFQEVDNNIVNQSFDTNHNKINNNSILNEYDYSNGNYGYYENVYSDLTEEIVQNIQKGNYIFPGENPALSSDDEKVAVKIPDSTNTRAVNSKSFSDGNDEFSSINEADADNTVDANTQADTQPDVSSDGNQASQPADSFSADTFSTGDFSDGISDSADGDIEDGDNSQTHVADGASADTDFNSVIDTGTDFSADANETVQADADSAQDAMSVENDDIQPIINYSEKKDKNGNVIKNEAGITELDAIGTSANPKVYYGVTIDQYPYYKYTLISDMKKIVACANANADAVQNGTFTPVQATTSGEREKNITFQDNQYWYWTVDENGNTAKNPISIVTQRQPVSYEDIREIPTTLLGYNYYYKVSQAYFCCKKSDSSEDSSAGTGEQLPYRYFGWYVPSYPQNQDVYIRVVENDGKTATHYISDAEYKLTPGIGNYDFVPDDTALLQKVEVNHMYYQGGYTNHDWFKQYVFHLEPGEAGSDERKQFDAFKIEVTTITAEDFNKSTGSDHSSADTSVNSDDAQADNSQTDDIQSDDVQTDNTSDYQNTDTQDANEAPTEDQAAAQNEGDTSEVDPMVSEAGVELVSIEKEISDSSNPDATSDSSVTADFQDGSDTEEQNATAPAATDTSLTEEDNAQISSDGSDEEEFTDSSDEQAAFSAGDTNSADTNNPLSEYDLIYVNGNINKAGFQKIYNSADISKSIPCIINAAKVNAGSEDNDLEQAVTSVEKTDDTDGHYVNTCVYFFKNTFPDENSANLINKEFNTNFNPDSEGSTFTDQNAKEGFEEILEYIESENQYRKIGQTTDGAQTFSDNKTNSDNTTADTSDSLLTKELTQARAIEYIINYKYKRKLNTKSTFNVLEIEPSKISEATLDQNSINKWLGYEESDFIKTSKVCCEYTNSGNNYAPGSYLFDGNDSTFWHSDWRTYSNGHDNGNGYHYIEVTFTKAMTITGFQYQPRPGTRGGDENGRIKDFKIYLYSDENCTTQIYEAESSFEYTDSIRNDSSLKTFPFPNNEAISGVKSVKIVIKSAGDSKIPGTNGNATSTKFASGSGLSFLVPSSSDATSPKMNLTSKTASEYVGHIDDICAEYDMIYIGDSIENRDPYVVGSGEFRYVHVGDGILARSNTTELLKLLGQLDIEYDDSWTGANGMRRFAPFDTYSAEGGGYFRGSGNDMTELDYEELMRFVKSGYPVVLGNNLLTRDRKVDSAKVDTASWYYQFMEEALKYPNVMTKAELDSGEKNIQFWINLAKPVINFDENGGKPPEPVRKGEIDDGSGKYGNIDGELKFTFTISNDSDASPATATYDCNLYLDLNFDGNFSNKEVQDKYVQITDEDGQVLTMSESNDEYELEAGRKYTLIRKIPKDYFKLITWKLEISNNQNSYIHTSATGYSKQTNPDNSKQTINVLQLVPKNSTWTLKGNSKFDNWMNQVDDFNVVIDSKSVSDFGNMTQEQVKELLDTKQMIIIGFADVYDNISNDNHAVDEILNFIKAGKSVLFAHDTTSYINYDWNKMYNKIAQTSYTGNTATETGATVYWDEYLHKGNVNNVTWGLSLNKILRSVVGMDRYGITSDDPIGETGVTVSELLRTGRALSSSSVNFKDLMKAAGDIAYQRGDCTSSYGQTQAYTNNLLKSRKLGTDGTKTTTAKKINDGAITQYPYRIPDTLSVAETHGQYYQLALEKDRDLSGLSDGKGDIVVWYCLSGSIYDESPNDVRNNYYFYSNKNVIYTGAGHSSVTGDDEIKLFVNAIVAAANVTAVKPEVNFVKNLNPTAEIENTRYYMTDQTSWTEDKDNKRENNTLEQNMDFYINVKDYNMVSADLNPDDLKNQKMILTFYVEDDNGSILSDEGNILPTELKTKPVTNINGNIGSLTAFVGEKDKKEEIRNGENGFQIIENNAYGFVVKDIERYLMKNENHSYKSNCKIWVKVTSTVSLYGKLTTNTSWASVNLKQRQLFDLD